MFSIYLNDCVVWDFLIYDYLWLKYFLEFKQERLSQVFLFDKKIVRGFVDIRNMYEKKVC